MNDQQHIKPGTQPTTPVRRFRKRPVKIEAIQWTGDNWNALRCFCPSVTIDMTKGKADPHIRTLEGTMSASVGDWIIKGVKGEFYPCKPDIFDASYEEIT